jgi:hypothetical protein
MYIHSYARQERKMPTTPHLTKHRPSHHDTPLFYAERQPPHRSGIERERGRPSPRVLHHSTVDYLIIHIHIHTPSCCRSNSNSYFAVVTAHEDEHCLFGTGERWTTTRTLVASVLVAVQMQRRESKGPANVQVAMEGLAATTAMEARQRIPRMRMHMHMHRQCRR